jgi:hypothetical protein
MQIIKVTRGASKARYKAASGDVYADTMEAFDASGQSVYFTDYCNSDATVGYNGGRLAKGVYNAIVGMHKGRYKAFKLFRPLPDDRLAKIESEDDLTLADRTLPSEIPNPNHGGDMIITCVNIHKGGENWDWSHGCITVLGDAFDRLMGHFAMNEIVIVEVI